MSTPLSREWPLLLALERQPLLLAQVLFDEKLHPRLPDGRFMSKVHADFNVSGAIEYNPAPEAISDKDVGWDAQPLEGTAYHGSAYGLGKARQDEVLHLTDDEDRARMYADRIGKKGTLHKVDYKANKALVIDTPDKLKAAFRTAKVAPLKRANKNSPAPNFQWYEGAALYEWASRHGYDAIRITPEAVAGDAHNRLARRSFIHEQTVLFNKTIK